MITSPKQELKAEDNDVERERQRILSGRAKGDALIIYNLSKVGIHLSCIRDHSKIITEGVPSGGQ